MIKFDSINLEYDGKEIFKNLSLKITKGDKVAILGRSGLGKSSLFSLIMGFVSPDSGQVYFDGKIINHHTTWSLRKKISFIDQDISLPAESVFDWITSIASLKANSHLNLSKDRIEDLAKTFQLDHNLLNKNISELSGGEKQRVAIIVSVLLDRKIFLLDEITSSLDKNLKTKVAKFFIGNPEWTVLVISHDHVWLDDPAIKIYDLETRQWKQ